MVQMMLPGFNTASGMPCANPVPWKPWYQWAENVICGAEAVIEVLSSKNLRKTCTKPYPHWCGAHSRMASAQSPAGTPYTIRTIPYFASFGNPAFSETQGRFINCKSPFVEDFCSLYTR